MRISFRCILSCCIGLALSACSAAVLTSPATLPHPAVPSPEQRAEVRETLDELLSESEFREDLKSQEATRAERIFDQLLQASGYQPGDFPIYCYDAGALANAMAFDGTAVVVFRQLVKDAKDDSQLAFALAHELVHVLSERERDNDDVNSREEEQQADSLALTVMRRAGFSSQGAEKFFDDLAAQARGSADLEALSDAAHPSALDRKQSLRRLDRGSAT